MGKGIGVRIGLLYHLLFVGALVTAATRDLTRQFIWIASQCFADEKQYDPRALYHRRLCQRLRLWRKRGEKMRQFVLRKPQQ